MPKRLLCSALLLLWIVALLQAPTVNSQSLTYGTAAEYQQRPTRKTNATTSSELNGTFVIPDQFYGQSEASCYYWYEPAPKLFTGNQVATLEANPALNLSQGQQMNVRLTADSPGVFFYIMNISQISFFISTWQFSPKGCVILESNIMASMLSSGQAVTSYSTSWVVPEDGLYYLVFFNPTPNDISVSFTATSTLPLYMTYP